MLFYVVCLDNSPPPDFPIDFRTLIRPRTTFFCRSLAGDIGASPRRTFSPTPLRNAFVFPFKAVFPTPSTGRATLQRRSVPLLCVPRRVFFRLMTASSHPPLFSRKHLGCSGKGSASKRCLSAGRFFYPPPPFPPVY